MHTVIFVAEIPGDRDQAVWREFTGDAQQKLKTEKDAIRLGENVWLIPTHESLRALAWLIATADRLRVRYGTLPLEHAPQWLPAGFDPSTILDRSEGA